MTGSALFDFLIAIVLLCIVVGIFFLTIDRIAPDDFFKKVAKWAIGGIALIAALFALRAVLFGGAGGVEIRPLGLLAFAVGILVALVVLYLVNLAIDYFAPDPWKTHIKYVLGAIVLIALLMLAAQTVFGLNLTGRALVSLQTLPFYV